MSAYRQIPYHIVFRTKGSEKTIRQEYRKDLYQYIWDIIKNKNCVLFQINGMEDHIHILSDFARNTIKKKIFKMKSADFSEKMALI